MNELEGPEQSGHLDGHSPETRADALADGLKHIMG